MQDSLIWSLYRNHMNNLKQKYRPERIRQNKTFSTYSQNVRSLTGKWTEFSEQMISLNSNNFKFSIIAIQEVWNVPPGIEYKLPGYKPLQFKIRDPTGMNGNSGGGVGVFVDEKLEYEKLEDLSVFAIGVFESQFLKVTISKNKLCSHSIYTIMPCYKQI